MKIVPMLDIMVTMNPFSKVKKVFPAHELPVYIEEYGANNIEVIGKNGENHDIETVEKEVERMVMFHGKEMLQQVFGTNFIDSIEVSINRVIEKEKEIDDSTNTAKSKNRARAEARV